MGCVLTGYTDSDGRSELIPRRRRQNAITSPQSRMGLRPHPWLLELIHPRFGKGSEPIKPVSLLLCAALLAGLLAPVAAAQEAAVEEEPGSYAGYIVKLSDDIPRMRTLNADASYDREGNFLVVDTLEQTQEIPEEYIDYIEPNYYVELFSTQDPSDPYYADYQWSLQEIGRHERLPPGADRRGGEGRLR